MKKILLISMLFISVCLMSFTLGKKSYPCHPAGDLGPCIHRMHDGDLGPCTHFDYYGNRIHLNDLYPCVHWVHTGDIYPCSHICY